MLISSRPLSMLACNAIPWFLQLKISSTLSSLVLNSANLEQSSTRSPVTTRHDYHLNLNQ